MRMQTRIRAGSAGCPPELCGSNHSEHLRSPYTDGITSGPNSHQPRMRLRTRLCAGIGVGGDDCPVWGCGANHNERMRDCV